MHAAALPIPLVIPARPETRPAAVLPMGLIERARAGDRSAFESIYHAEAGRVYALALRLAADAPAARELVQDVFIRAWERLETFRGDAALSSWLHRLTVNLFFQQRRAERRRLKRVEPRSELPHGAAPASSAAARIDLEQAIRGLPDGAREVFVLHDVEGYRHDEIGKMTGIAVGTSKAQLHRARELLRKVLTA